VIAASPGFGRCELRSQGSPSTPPKALSLVDLSFGISVERLNSLFQRKTGLYLFQPGLGQLNERSQW